MTWWMRLRWRAREARRDALWRAVHWGWREFQQAGLVTADTPAGRAFRRFGPGSLMAFPPGSVFGEGGIEIGDGTLIGQLVTMSAGMVPGQDLGGLAVLTIGDRCVIGRGSHIVAHQSVEIGDDVWTGPYVYITDQNHGYEDPGVPIGNQFPVNRPVSIGAGSWLGAGAIILPGARIGRNVVVAAGSVVRGNVQDWCVVAGVPAKVIREHTQVGWQPARATGQKPGQRADREPGREPGPRPDREPGPEESGQKPAPRPGQKPAPRPDRAPDRKPGPKEPGPKEPGQERGQKPGQAVGQP